jgi:hypothetical protein
MFIDSYPILIMQYNVIPNRVGHPSLPDTSVFHYFHIE